MRGLKLHRWHLEPDNPQDAAMRNELLKPRGAYVMGRNMFGPIRGEWDEDWRGWWGDEPPYHAPVFVLTNYAHDSIEMQGGTSFQFVTDGFDAALERARAAAGDREVDIAGGAATVRQAFAAKAIDEWSSTWCPCCSAAASTSSTASRTPALSPSTSSTRRALRTSATASAADGGAAGLGPRGDRSYGASPLALLDRSAQAEGLTVERVVPDLASDSLERSKRFYLQVFGLEPIMELGWIATLADPTDPGHQISVITHDATAPVLPDVSLQVDDVDVAYAAAVRAGAEIVHPLTDEPWGVRRFFVRDPDGHVLNVLSHRASP